MLPRAWLISLQQIFSHMQNALKILENSKGKSAGIFVDDANLFYVQKDVGWEVDWQKLKDFLNTYVTISLSRYYMGTPVTGKALLDSERVKLDRKEAGFVVVTKPLKKIYIDHEKQNFKNKCNFDVEIAFDIARNIANLDVVIVVSGDSDLLESKNFCLEHHKKFLVMCFEKRVAWEIWRIHHIFFEDIKEYIIKNKPRW